MFHLGSLNPSDSTFRQEAARLGHNVCDTLSLSERKHGVSRVNLMKGISIVASCLAVVTLAGCSGATSSNAPSTSFTVPIPLQQAYDRAMAQTNYCLMSDDNAPITAQISPDAQRAQIQVLMRFTNTVAAEMGFQARGADSTVVDVRMWGINIWNRTAVDAMEAAIRFGVPSCVNYFPGKSASAETAAKKRR